MEELEEVKFEPKPVFVMEWNSYFFPYVKYVGYIEDKFSRTGRILMSLGRTKEEAELLSYNKQCGKIWRIEQYIKQNE